MVINQTQTMHIGKSTARGKKGKSLGLRVETVQTAVFRTTPQNPLIILENGYVSFARIIRVFCGLVRKTVV